MNVAALMPVKGFRNAKQRLNPLLNSVARERLAEIMFRDVLRQVRLARGLAGTFVVTGDERIALDVDEPQDLERFLSYGFEDSEAARVARQLLAEPHMVQSPRSGDA